MNINMPSMPSGEGKEKKDWKAIIGQLKELGKEHCEPGSMGEKHVKAMIVGIKNGYTGSIPKVYEANKDDFPPAIQEYVETEILG